MNRRASPLSRVVRGALLGLFVATCFSGFATLLWYSNDRSLGFLNVELGGAILLYMVWGPSCGAVAGLLVPITKQPQGAALVGAMVLTSGLLGAQFLRGATLVEYMMGLLLGAVVGGVAGVRVAPRFWSRWGDGGKEPSVESGDSGGAVR